MIAIAGYAAPRRPGLVALVATLGATLVAAGLIALEPDLGTSIVLGGTWLVICVACGVPWRTLGGLAASAAALAPVALVANLGASVQLDALARAHEEINASGRK